MIVIYQHLLGMFMNALISVGFQLFFAPKIKYNSSALSLPRASLYIMGSITTVILNNFWGKNLARFT